MTNATSRRFFKLFLSRIVFFFLSKNKNYKSINLIILSLGARTISSEPRIQFDGHLLSLSCRLTGGYYLTSRLILKLVDWVWRRGCGTRVFPQTFLALLPWFFSFSTTLRRWWQRTWFFFIIILLFLEFIKTRTRINTTHMLLGSTTIHAATFFTRRRATSSDAPTWRILCAANASNVLRIFFGWWFRTYTFLTRLLLYRGGEGGGSVLFFFSFQTGHDISVRIELCPIMSIIKEIPGS